MRSSVCVHFFRQKPTAESIAQEKEALLAIFVKHDSKPSDALLDEVRSAHLHICENAKAMHHDFLMINAMH